MDRILVIAPHADDEILGCGGVIKKLINESKDVYVLIVTNAHIGDPEKFSQEKIDNVRNEALAAHRFLGVKKTFFMNFPAPRLDTYPSYKIASAFAELFQQYAFDTVFIPHRGDIHKDHKIVFESALVAGRPIENSVVKRIYSYETLSETEWAAPYACDSFIPNVFVMLSEAEFLAKCEALKFFESQLRFFPMSRSVEAVEALAKYRGATISCPRAEAFMLIREIR